MDKPRITLKPREDIRIRAGHPWIYDNEIASMAGTAAPGGEIEVFDSRGLCLGSAFWNPHSKIRARLYSRERIPADADWFVKKLETALRARRRYFDPETQSQRLIFGEADGMPGLIVDVFSGEAAGKRGRWAVAQILSLGMEERREFFLEALERVLPCDGVMERSDAPVRAFEGLGITLGVIDGTVPPSILMKENGLVFDIDLAGGQKTGWFLDQRSNRAATARHAAGKRVLDCFCNQGGFGLACAAAGAKEVLGIDSSSHALAGMIENAGRNGLAHLVSTREANAFDALRELGATNQEFGLVILDPPAFAKNRASVDSARRGYREINIRALKLLKAGGILVTNTCSHWFGPELFMSMLEEAARDSGRRFRVLEERSQDLDHPIVSGYLESRYLTCRILEVLEN